MVQCTPRRIEAFRHRGIWPFYQHFPYVCKIHKKKRYV